MPISRHHSHAELLTVSRSVTDIDGWKAFHDDHVGLEFGEPLINGPLVGALG